MKTELKRHSYLTMSKHVSTADQIIRMIDLNGGRISSQDYTPNYDKDHERKKKHVRHLMNWFKELDFNDWHEITVDTLHEWITKLSSLSSKQMKVHNVFNPKDLKRELREINYVKSHQFKSTMD